MTDRARSASATTGSPRQVAPAEACRSSSASPRALAVP